MTLQQLRYALAISDNGSINGAAKELFISQSSLSGSLKELENEIGISIFARTNRGITLTPEGDEFLSCARQVADQFGLLYERYVEKRVKEKFSVSMQHYTFAVKAFIDTIKTAGIDRYEFAVYETTTAEVIEHVKSLKSEIGVLYRSGFNEKALTKIISENGLEFVELFWCDTYVYLWRGHPLAERERISMQDLAPYPCLAFDQGKNNSFYLAEEMNSTYEYERLIRASDRATLLNLMVGLNAYTLCSGIICEELNGEDYKAIPLVESEKICIGYVKQKGIAISPIGEVYIHALKHYSD
ncbi:MAG: LysR family transcriptional regulator [Lachnospiraceae bacterium]|nr:LysR family transcriptional regulator [Lachnospiraceae bacterium]